MVESMLAALAHRGPDGRGLAEVAPGTWLGNRRLAILDLSPAGHMPMTDSAGCWITYNGEVYNFEKIAACLTAHHGFRPRSSTDTEVVLASWTAWGPEALRRLRGMFAFAVFDPRSTELVLARDPLGKKPLYYAQGDGWFAFASEVRALLSSGLIARRLDGRGVRSYLHNGFMVDPLTLVEGIRALLPGHLLRVDLTGRAGHPVSFWKGPLRESEGLELDEPAFDRDALRSTFEEAVRIRLVADVPLGAFLSSGLDSIAVVGEMARAENAPRTFTVSFPGQRLDESMPAAQVATAFQTAHEEVVLGEDQIASWLAEGLAALDQPTFDGLNTYLVARAAKGAGLTVALSGIGGDELFGGYPFLRHARRLAALIGATGLLRGGLRPFSRLATLQGPGKLLAALGGSSGDPLPLVAYQATQALFPEPAASRLFEGGEVDGVLHGLPIEFVEFLSAESAEAPLIDQLSHLALRLFLGQRILRDTDSVSMAVSLEVRAPFTDRLLVEKAFSVPGRLRCAGIPDKPFERELLAPLYPLGYPMRPKQGFILPFADWLTLGGPLHDTVRDCLLERDAARKAGLNPRAVEGVLRRAPNLGWSRLWSLFVLVDWSQRYGIAA